jgi:hypothetical protein
MAKRSESRRGSLTQQDHELMEVHGFDLLSQIEAMLRHVRQYQREVQRLRGLMGRGQTSTADLPPIEAVDRHLIELRKACSAFMETLDEIVKTHQTIMPNGAMASDKPKKR